jgi:hypothetical protein
MDHMTETEKKYLLFLSPRTPRPKSAQQPGKKIIQRMMDRGWISAKYSDRFKIPTYYITPTGEQALTRATSPGVHMKSDVMWREVECMPEGHECLITDGSIVRTGTRLPGDLMAAGVVTPIGMWTHWAAMPLLPLGIMFIPERDQ